MTSAVPAGTSLDDAELRHSRLPSGWTPLELLKHLVHVERRWLVWRFEGQDVGDPWAQGSDRRGRLRHDPGMGLKDGERVHAETVAQWRAWLAEHADRGAGAWLVSWKKATGRPALSYEEAVLEALAVGWVDSTAGTVDDERSMLWFAPRKRGSGWSRPNKQRLERLEREGRMRDRGRAVVEAARADGSWTLLDDVEDLVVPPDLAEAFARSPARARRGRPSLAR